MLFVGLLIIDSSLHCLLEVTLGNVDVEEAGCYIASEDRLITS